MKKVILILNLMFLAACNNIEKKTFFPMEKIIDGGFRFQEGDILILNKLPNIYSVFGHSAIVLEGGKVGEFPLYGYGYIEIGLADWMEGSRDREITVLRAYLGENQKNELKKLIKFYSDAQYGIFNKKFSTEEFYCSSFIWRIYFDLGIDLDKTFKFFVLPYDFLRNKNLKKIKPEESYN